MSWCFAFWIKISWHFNLGISFFSLLFLGNSLLYEYVFCSICYDLCSEIPVILLLGSLSSISVSISLSWFFLFCPFHIYSLLLSCVFPLDQWFHFQEFMFYCLLFLIPVLSVNNTVWTSFCFLRSNISFFILLCCSSPSCFSIFLIEFMSQSSYETFFSSLN